MYVVTRKLKVVGLIVVVVVTPGKNQIQVIEMRVDRSTDPTMVVPSMYLTISTNTVKLYGSSASNTCNSKLD